MLDFLIQYGYLGVFLAAFLAATVLPFSSEVVLSGVLLSGADYWSCIFAATLGNWLGGMTCYRIGTLGKKEWIVRYLKMSEEKIDRVTRWLKGRGSFMAFFVFLPGIGDFFAVALGLLRANVWGVAAFMLAGKFFRYLVWVRLVDWIIAFF